MSKRDDPIPDIALQLFGPPQGEDESSEPGATEPQPGAESSKGADRSPRGDPEDAAAEHSKLLAHLFTDPDAKQQADAEFFAAPGFEVDLPTEDDE